MKHTTNTHLIIACETEEAVVVVEVVEDGVDDDVEVDTAGAGLLKSGGGSTDCLRLHFALAPEPGPGPGPGPGLSLCLCLGLCLGLNLRLGCKHRRQF